MSNTADSSPNISATLDEDSDVIELTEEVKPEVDPVGEEDDLALAMPEFRVPTGQHDTLDVEDSEGDHEFDREELVRTVRMEAFDRTQLEILDSVRSLGVQGELLDQSCAPDVLVGAPRVLTRRWHEGPPEQSEGHQPAHSVEDARAALATTTRSRSLTKEDVEHARQEPTAVDTSPVPDATVDKSAEDVEVDEPAEPAIEEATEGPHEGEDSPIELDSEVLEDVVKSPPPRPKGVPARPPKTRHTPGRKRATTKPIPVPEAKPKPSESFIATSPESAPQADDDDDLSGIVQELLEEKKPETQRSPEEIKREQWFNDFFTDEYLRTLSKDLKDHTAAEVEFIVKSLGVKKGARIFDLACGFGRHSIELAKMDYEVAGLDLSRALLQRALNEAQRRSLAIKFIHGDMRELNFKEIFDACFCWQTSFGYFDDKTNFRVLQGVHRALKAGGRFLLEVVNRDYVISEMPLRTWWEGVECVFLEEVEFDYESSVMHTKRSFIYEDGSPPKEFSSYIRLYSLHELERILDVAGFDVAQVSGELHHRGSFLGPNSSKIIILAEKR